MLRKDRSLAGWKAVSVLSTLGLVLMVGCATAFDSAQERRDSMEAAVSMKRELSHILEQVNRVEIEAVETTGFSRVAVLERGDRGFTTFVRALEAASVDGVSTRSSPDRRLILVRSGDRYQLMACTADGRITDERIRSGDKIGVLYLDRGGIGILR